MKIKINKLTQKTIQPYGYIIDSACVTDSGSGNSFGILLKERSDGWRIGYLIVRDRTMQRLECHQDSLETFEPVKGEAVIVLATHENPNNPKAFLLDKPVVLNKGVWHNVKALSKVAELKIFENIDVKTEYHPLKDIVAL